MTKLKTITLGLVASVTLLAAGCGGATTSSSGPAGASLVRPDALAFVAIDSDLGSDQWKQVDTLSKKFPGRDLALSKLKQSLAKEQIDYNRDVEPALGSEVDIVFASGATPDDTAVVGLTKPKDAGKFKELV